MSKQAFEPLESYHETPVYPNRDAAKEATGEEIAEFTAERRPKYWRILQPENVTGVQFFPVDDVPMVLFPRAFFGKVSADGKIGILEALVMSVEETKTFNIPPSGTGMTNVPGAEKPARPVPIKPLTDSQQIQRGEGPTSGYGVRNLDVPSPIVASGAWTAETIAEVVQAARKINAAG